MDFLNARGKKRSHFSGDDGCGQEEGGNAWRTIGVDTIDASQRPAVVIFARGAVDRGCNNNEGEEEQQQRQGSNDGRVVATEGSIANGGYPNATNAGIVRVAAVRVRRLLPRKVAWQAIPRTAQ